MMEAFASETAHEAAAHGAFYEAPEFWVAIAFVICVGLIARPVARIITTGLDNRADTIRKQIEDAENLRDEARELLATFERKQRDLAKETEEIVTRAREEAKRQTERAAEDLEKSLKRREQQALDRIQQAEASALDEVRAIAVDVAMQATRQVLVDSMTAPKANKLIDGAIKELPDKLH